MYCLELLIKLKNLFNESPRTLYIKNDCNIRRGFSRSPFGVIFKRGVCKERDDRPLVGVIEH